MGNVTTRKKFSDLEFIDENHDSKNEDNEEENNEVELRIEDNQFDDEIDFRETEFLSTLGFNALLYCGFLKLGNEEEVPVICKFFTNTKKLFTDQRIADGFVERIKILQRMKHPNIVKCYGSISNPRKIHGKIGVFVEYCENRDLRRSLERDISQKGRLTFSEKIQILEDVCNALKYLDTHQLVHKNLRCEHVVLTKKNRAKLLINNEITTFLLTSGDLRYRHSFYWKEGEEGFYWPPEIVNIDVRSWKPKSTIYCLGTLMFELLTEDFRSGSLSPYFRIRDVNIEAARDPKFRPPMKKDLYTHLFVAPCLKWYIRLMRHCWDADLHQRPEIRFVYNIVQANMKKSVELYEHQKIFFHRFNFEDLKSMEVCDYYSGYSNIDDDEVERIHFLSELMIGKEFYKEIILLKGSGSLFILKLFFLFK